MTGLALLIPIALLMGMLGLLAFFWALRNGQFDDFDGAAARILIDEDDACPRSVPPSGPGHDGSPTGAEARR